MESNETQLIRGALTVSLGDGSLRYRKRPKGTTTRLVLCHCAAQRDYLIYKVDTFIRPFMQSAAKIRDYMARSGKGRPAKYPSARIEFENIRLIPAYNLLYPNGYKEISHPVLSLLGVPAIATMFMDDGTLDRSRALICMNSHSDSEVDLVSSWIEALTGAKSYMWKSPVLYKGYTMKQKNLCFNADQAGIFLDAIRPHAAPGMEYKFDY